MTRDPVEEVVDAMERIVGLNQIGIGGQYSDPPVRSQIASLLRDAIRAAGYELEVYHEPTTLEESAAAGMALARHAIEAGDLYAKGLGKKAFDGSNVVPFADNDYLSRRTALKEKREDIE